MMVTLGVIATHSPLALAARAVVAAVAMAGRERARPRPTPQAVHPISAAIL